MLCVILVDALDKSYLQHMPYLTQLSKRNIFVKEYLPLVGYEHRHYVIWSKYPDEINKFSMYLYNKETSPYRYLKKINGILTLIGRNRTINKIIRYMINLILKLRHKTINYNIGNIPFEYAPYFDLSGDKIPLEEQKLLSCSIFEVLKQNNITYEYMWYPFKVNINDDHDKLKYFFSRISKNKPDVFFLHLSELDKLGHQYGFSKNIIAELKVKDMQLQKIIAKSSKFIVFGDHGMINVNNHIDIIKPLEELRLKHKFKIKFVYFVDSTILRFWNLSSESTPRVLELLNKYKKYGSIIDDKNSQQYHVKFKDYRFGELLFVLNKGNIFKPSFFTDKLVKGMHGYLPKDNPSVLICSSQKRRVIESASDVDIAPTIVDLLNLKIPPEFSGRSLLKIR